MAKTKILAGKGRPDTKEKSVAQQSVFFPACLDQQGRMGDGREHGSGFLHKIGKTPKKS